MYIIICRSTQQPDINTKCNIQKYMNNTWLPVLGTVAEH